MKILRSKEIKKITGLSSTTIWRLEKKGKFPKRFKITDHLVGWYEGEIEEWVSLRRAETTIQVESLT